MTTVDQTRAMPRAETRSDDGSVARRPGYENEGVDCRRELYPPQVYAGNCLVDSLGWAGEVNEAQLVQVVVVIAEVSVLDPLLLPPPVVILGHHLNPRAPTASKVEMGKVNASETLRKAHQTENDCVVVDGEEEALQEYGSWVYAVEEHGAQPLELGAAAVSKQPPLLKEEAAEVR